MQRFFAMFLQAYGIGQWLLLFYLCAFAGWCWEVSLHLVRERRFVNRGFLTGPLLPIYGFGALLVLFVGLPLADRPLLAALVGTLAASVLEYLTGAVMEALFHVRYWDYSDQKWNLHGHICLLSAAVWAAMAWLMTCVLQPMILPLLHRVPDQLALCAGLALTVFSLADMAVSLHRALDLRALLERFERRSDILHDARMLSRMKKAQRLLRRNPGATSLRHRISLERIAGYKDEIKKE